MTTRAKETRPRVSRVPLRPHTSRPWSAGRTKYCETCVDYYNNRASDCPYCRTEKACRICGVVKPLTQFYVWSPNADGRDTECIECVRDELHPRVHYKMAAGAYRQLVRDQHGLCAICSQPPKPGSRLHVDHDHESGKIRGLLCLHCNHGLGNFADNTKRLLDAVAYLERTAA